MQTHAYTTAHKRISTLSVHKPARATPTTFQEAGKKEKLANSPPSYNITCAANLVKRGIVSVGLWGPKAYREGEVRVIPRVILYKNRKMSNLIYFLKTNLLLNYFIYCVNSNKKMSNFIVFTV